MKTKAILSRHEKKSPPAAEDTRGGKRRLDTNTRKFTLAAVISTVISFLTSADNQEVPEKIHAFNVLEPVVTHKLV